MFVGLLWIVFTICVGILANRYNRSIFGYVVLSLFISPLITGIVLLCLGENRN